ncbi:hypothetical protein BC827DRAFT_1219839 [Russula dissimulans]|nr:hypothetical protein BC827DRAFT_1219839 [Russula dissimulans]
MRSSRNVMLNCSTFGALIRVTQTKSSKYLLSRHIGGGSQSQDPPVARRDGLDDLYRCRLAAVFLVDLALRRCAVTSVPQSRVYGTDPSVKRTLRCQYYSTMPMALHYGSKRRGSLSRPALFIKFQVSCGNNIRLWPGCRRQEEIKCSWMRPQMSQMVIRAHLAWLRGGLVIISRCDICQWVQGLAASPYPQPCMLNQHNIYAQIVHCTRAINRTCQVEA